MSSLTSIFLSSTISAWTTDVKRYSSEATISGAVSDSIPVFWGKVSYRSIGSESDNLVAALANGYGLPSPRPVMSNAIHFTAVSLSGDPRQLAEGAVRMKLFFEGDDPAHYAEVYTNLDVAQRSGQVHEKDQEYRRPLLRALTTAAL